jgi:hypothetical protein
MGVRVLTDLNRACEGSGLVIIEEDGWQYAGHGAHNYPRTVALHHTAGPVSGDCPSHNTVKYGRADLPGPLANLFLCRSGTVHVIAAGCAYHAGAVTDPDFANQNSIGIEAEATGVDPWPAVEYDAYLALCRSLTRWYGLGTPANLGHKEICSPPGRKIDPNFDMPEFRTDMSSIPALHRKVVDTMIERPIVAGNNQYMRIVCPVGSASSLVNKGFLSVSASGGFRCKAGFQKSAPTDGPAPGAGPMWEVSEPNAMRGWVEMPSGTEYVELWYSAEGPGSVLIETEPK